jgi:ankyrin repeat protein
MEYMKYINSLTLLNGKIYELPRLSKEDINNLKLSHNEKLFLFGFYEHYNELNNYDIKELDNIILGHSKINLLMCAAFYNKIRLIKYLIARGINININDKNVNNAYYYVLKNPNVKLKTLKLLENNGINIHKIDKYGNNSCLIYIRHFSKIRVLEHLRLHNINMYKFNNSGLNLYLYAIIFSNFKIIKYLEANGFNIHIKNKYNYNAYNYNIDYKMNNYIRVLKYINSRNIKMYSKQTIFKPQFKKYIRRFNSTKVYKYYIIYIYKCTLWPKNSFGLAQN